MILQSETSRSPRRMPKRHAFSLIEVVVVLFLGGILLGLLLPYLYSAQLGAGRREGANKLRTHCLAMHSVNDVYKKLPPAFDKFGAFTVPASVHIHIMPFMEMASVHQALLREEGKGEAANLLIATFLAPDDPSSVKQDLKGIQNFAANLRVFSTKGLETKYEADMPALAEVEPGTASIPRTFPDGTSNTILFATKYGYCDKGGSRYMAPPNAPTAAFFGQNAARVKAHPSNRAATFQLRPGPKECCTSPLMAQSFYETGLQLGLGDGSVRQISSKISTYTWNAAVHPADGQPLGADWND
jgi:prepilin-type N-terminal cleavage/methylation domain-containing protein